jgi:hypothetical protein
MPRESGPPARARSRTATAGRGQRSPRRGALAWGLAWLAVLAGGVMLFLPHPAQHTRSVAAVRCGLVRCSARLPASAQAAGSPARVTAVMRPDVHTVRAHASPARSPHKPSGSATPSPTPPSVLSPGPPISVTYALLHSSPQGPGWNFLGQITVTNRTSAAITGWNLQVALGQDFIQWVSTSSSGWPQYPDWHPAGANVSIDGSQPFEAVPAHGTLVFYLQGAGPQTRPAGCAFNGAPGC